MEEEDIKIKPMLMIIVRLDKGNNRLIKRKIMA